MSTRISWGKSVLLVFCNLRSYPKAQIVCLKTRIHVANVLGLAWWSVDLTEKRSWIEWKEFGAKGAMRAWNRWVWEDCWLGEWWKEAMGDLGNEKLKRMRKQSKEMVARCGKDSGIERNRMEESFKHNVSRFGHFSNNWKNKSTYSCDKLAATSSTENESRIRMVLLCNRKNSITHFVCDFALFNKSVTANPFIAAITILRPKKQRPEWFFSVVAVMVEFWGENERNKLWSHTFPW